MSRVPLVVLTGFLGAGKTTIVNALIALRAARGEGRAKLGVIVNELGAIGIDGALLGGEGTEKQIELPGGCVCCAMGDELDKTLVELVTNNPSLEAILLETTGAAEPIPIAWATERDPVRAHVRTAVVVTVVDAANLARSRAISAAVDAQLAYADAILETKRELATPEEQAACDRAVAELAPRVIVRHGTTSEHAAWLDEILRDPPLTDRSAPTESDHVHSDDCRHLDGPHAHGIDSVWVPFEGEVDLEDLEDALAALPANYVRIKGIVHGNDPRDGTSGWYAVHRVGLRVSSEAVAPPAFSGRIVALGPDVRREELVSALLPCS